MQTQTCEQPKSHELILNSINYKFAVLKINSVHTVVQLQLLHSSLVQQVSTR